MSAGGGKSLRAILYAFLANLGIAVAKFAAALYTGSSSMLAEAIHSTADSGNQLLLLLGLNYAKKPPTEEHPLGHGKARRWCMNRRVAHAGCRYGVSPTT